MRQIFLMASIAAVSALVGGVIAYKLDLYPAKYIEVYKNNMHDNMVIKPSAHSVDVTIDRLEAAARKKGLNVFARINHQENAAKLDLKMPASTLLIFGSPKLGSPLMNAAPTIGIDLPVKALAYEDKDGKVYISYNNPDYLKMRHNVKGADNVLGKMAKALDGLTTHAASE